MQYSANPIQVKRRRHKSAILILAEIAPVGW